MTTTPQYNISQIKKARKIVREASKLLSTKGHCKKKYCTSSGKYCIVGAINFCHHGSAFWNCYDIDLLNIIYDELNNLTHKDFGVSLINWNDKSETTITDVTNLLAKLDKKLLKLSKN